MTDRRIRLEPYVTAPPTAGGTIVDTSPGPEGDSLSVLSLESDPDYRKTAPSGVSFAKIRADSEQDFLIRSFRDGDVSDVRIGGQTWNFHFCQPLPGGRWLLAGARCRRHSDGSHDKNGLVFDASGKLEREFPLGDGIQQVQTTSDGKIWTSYFDEGVFGNYGWDQPVGAPGLICWSSRGEKLYEFAAVGKGNELDPIADCYALNVASDQDTWICYYTEFPLVRITDREISGVWEQPAGATHAFAVSNDRVLFQGGYDDADRFCLCEFARGDQITLMNTLVFQDRSGRGLSRVRCSARGPFLFLFAENDVYRVDVRTLG